MKNPAEKDPIKKGVIDSPEAPPKQPIGNSPKSEKMEHSGHDLSIAKKRNKQPKKIRSINDLKAAADSYKKKPGEESQ